MINTVIFDLDGTLLNTLDDLYYCFNYSIVRFGYPKRTKDEIRSFVGNGIKKAIERALPYKIAENELNTITENFKSYYKDHMYDKTCLYTGIKEMLDFLKQNGYKIGVVSNKYDEAVKNLCNKYLNDYVDYAVGEGYGVEKKPCPDGVLKVMNEIGSTKENTIYVGDSEVDIRTAQNVGIPCISVLWGYKDRNFLVNNGGKVFANSPVDIIKIIEKKIYLI